MEMTSMREVRRSNCLAREGSPGSRKLISKFRAQRLHLPRQPPMPALLRPSKPAGYRDVVRIALVLIELGLPLDGIHHEIDDADRSQHALALAGLHLCEVPRFFWQARFRDRE